MDKSAVPYVKKFGILLGAIVFLVIVALVTYGQCVGLDLSHDEHQFIAPAVLWAREGLLPYRDTPLFHQPYLIWLDSFVVKNAASPLLATRLVSGTAAFLTGLLLFACAWTATKRQPNHLRLVASVSITLLWLTSPLFLASSGRTWNHDLPSLLALTALALLLFSAKPTHRHWLAAGLLAGLATGGRLTFAPFAGLLPLTALLWRDLPLKTRLLHLVTAALGTAAALAPSAWLYLQSPSGYLFGNLEFPRLPLLEADNSRILKTITPWRKIRFFFKEIVLIHLPLALILLILGITFLRREKHHLRWIIPALALLAGAFAPSRYELQHFYIAAPLAALLIAYFLSTARPPLVRLPLVPNLPIGNAVASVEKRGEAISSDSVVPESPDSSAPLKDKVILPSKVSESGDSKTSAFPIWRLGTSPIYLLLTAAFISTFLNIKNFTYPTQLLYPADWDVTRVHQQGLKLRRALPDGGRILTLAPIVALEGGFSIYPSLATGPFGWKFAYLLPAPRRQKLGLLSADDLETLAPPIAILTGYDTAKLEKPLLAYAKTHGYLPTPFTDSATLWRKP